MTTTAATSLSKSATSSSSTDDSQRILDNDGASPLNTARENNGRLEGEQQPTHNQTPSANSHQNDESKHTDQPQANAKHANSTFEASATSAKNLDASPPPITSSSSSSTLPSGLPSINDVAVDAKPDQSPPTQNQSTMDNGSTNTEQKRPMNAFLLYCKRQRSLVREMNPNLENRGITKILGEKWADLKEEEKSKYKTLARQHKEAFMKANPDFKWCKTPNVSNHNNNISNNTTTINDNCTNASSNEQKHQQNSQFLQNPHPNNLQRQQTHNNLIHHHNQIHQNHHLHPTTNVELLSLNSMHHNHNDIMHHSNSSSMDVCMLNRQQLEAPKPPKKRFLERNDSIYTSKDNNSLSSRHDSNMHGADVVPCISLDQDILDRVIDKAFSEDSNSSKPSGISNSCKCSNRTSNNLTLQLSNSSNNPMSFSTTTITTTTTSSSTPAYSMNIDEPVDFSMNRTINTTRQQIINNLVEKMLSEPSDDAASSFSKLNGGDSHLKSYAGPPMKKDKPDAT